MSLLFHCKLLPSIHSVQSPFSIAWFPGFQFNAQEMAPSPQEYQVLLSKDASFDSILHKGTAGSKEGFAAVLKKDKEAHKAAVAEYFQHWDNKDAKSETEAVRAVSSVASRVNNSIHC